MLPPKNPDDVIFMIEQLEGRYNALLAGYEEDEMFYEGLIRDKIEIPEAGYDVTIPGTGRSIVDEAVDNVNPTDIWVRYTPRLNSRGKTTQDLEDQADEVRQFLGSWFRWNRKVASDIDPVRGFIKNLFMHGKAVLKCHVDWRFWPIIPQEELERINGLSVDEKNELADRIEAVRNSNTPLIFRNIHPKNIIEDPTIGGKKLWIIEHYDMELSEVIVWFKDAIDKEFGEEWWQRPYPFESYEVHEFWSADWFDSNGKFNRGQHYVFINKQIVINEKNPYVDIPYSVKYSGFGLDLVEGKLEQKAVGLYTVQVKSLLLAEARRLTQFDAVISQMSWPIIILPDDIDPDEFSFAPGDINSVPKIVFENMNNIFMSPRVFDAQFLNSLNYIGQQLERSTVPRTFRGAGVPGTDSAAQYNSISAQGKLRIEAVKEVTEDAIAEIMSKGLMYIETILKSDVSVPVGDRKGSGKYVLSPNKIGGKWDVAVEFQPNEDAIKERKLVLATNAKTSGMNAYDAYSIAGYDNPGELVARDIIYAVMFSPEVIKGISRQLAKDWGLDIDEIQVEDAMQSGINQDTIQDFMNQLFNGGDMQGQSQNMNNPPQNPQEAMQTGQPIPGDLPTVPGMEQPPGRPPVPSSPEASDIMGLLNGLR